MATKARYHTSRRPAKSELNGVIREANRKGGQLADELFSSLRSVDAPTIKGGNGNTRKQRQWALKRRQKLDPMCEGTARIVGKPLWNLASQCMADTTGRTVVLFLLGLYRAGAQKYVRLTLEAALSYHARIDSKGIRSHGRSFASARARGIATLAIVFYHLRTKRRGDDGPSQYGWAVRGLPRMTFYLMLTYWEHSTRASSRLWSLTTLWGRNGGSYDRGRVGWVQALVDVGAIRTYRPAHWTVPDWEKGKWKTDPKLGDVRWAFVRLELLIGDEHAPELSFESPSVVVVPPAWLAETREPLNDYGRRLLAQLRPAARPPPD